MRHASLTQRALGIAPPWKVTEAEFDLFSSRLDVHIYFSPGSRFACPVCGAECPVHDIERKSWRQRDFFQYQAWLHARVPRVRCDIHGINEVATPWAKPGRGFTLLFIAECLLASSVFWVE